MADTRALYSYNGQEPKFLPHEIKLSNGASRTDASTFTDEELLDAGYTGPYIEPEFDLLTQERNWDSETMSYVVTNLPVIEDGELEQLRWDSLRFRRTNLLRESDWVFIGDAPSMAESKKEEWREYRQLLRDFPDTITDIMEYNDIAELSWPVEPNNA
jgi:hypothetical protein